MTARSDRLLDKLVLLAGEIDSARTAKVVDVLAEGVASYPQTHVDAFDIIVAGRWRRIYLKLEGVSPWGSIKGRTAVGHSTVSSARRHQ